MDENLKNKIENLFDIKEFSDIIFLCIGSSRIIGDAIGPIVGSNLKYIENNYIHIYGSIEKNLNFNNAKEIIENINFKYKNPCIITIDSALSNKYDFGNIILEKGFMKIGKALEKNLCIYSNLNIKCVVGKKFFDKKRNLETLQQVPKTEIIKISNIISNEIKNIVENISLYV